VGIAIILDPRYKFKLLEYFFPKFYGSSSAIEINNTKKLCYSLFEEYQAKAKGIVKNSTLHENDIEPNLDNLHVNNFLIDYESFVNETIEIQIKSKLDLISTWMRKFCLGVLILIFLDGEKQMGSSI